MTKWTPESTVQTMTDTLTTTPLYANETDGRIVCPTHAGRYLTAAIFHEPGDSEWWTPLGTWLRITAADLETWLAEMGEPMTCEDCRSAARPDLRIVR